MEVMGANNIQLTESRFSELAQIAQAQGKTPDELADEAVAMLVRKSQLEELMDFGQRHSAALGISEHDVDRLIAENRIERRG